MDNKPWRPVFPAYGFCALSNTTPAITLNEKQASPDVEEKHLRVVHKKASSQHKGISWTWVLITVFTMLLLSALYCLACHPDGALGGRPFRGYVLGIVNAVIITFITLYSARKRLNTFSAGQLETWLNLHIRIGIISMFLALMHSGYHVAGVYSLALFPAFVLTIASGIFGGFCYRLIPRSISTKARYTFGKEEIMLRQMALLTEVYALTTQKSDSFNKVYEKDIKHHIYNKRNGFLLFLNSFRKKHTPHAVIEKIRKNSAYIQKNEADALEKLISKVCEKFELEEKLFSMNVVDRWRDVHIVLSSIMLSLLGIHIVSVFYF